MTNPRGLRGTGTGPRPGSLASLSLTRSPPTEKTTLGIEWVKLDILRFERVGSALSPPYPKVSDGISAKDQRGAIGGFANVVSERENEGF